MRSGFIGKAAVTAALLAACGLWCWTGWKYYISERHMTVVRATIRTAPIIALGANAQAYEAFSLPSEIRRQYGGSLLAAMLSGRARVEPSAADMIWRIALTVGEYDTSGLVMRASYLLNNEREKLPPVVDKLIAVAPWSSETWIIEAYRQLIAGNRSAAKAALERAKTTRRAPPEIIEKLEQTLRDLP